MSSAPPSESASQASSSKPARVRLHIKPFNPDLLKAYIPKSLLPLATNISYHTIETFAEKGFGYIELPAMDAQKLKKKLNGSILKGQKVKVDEAKPEKRKVQQEAEEVEDIAEEISRKKKRRIKEKKINSVIPGVELPEDRKVKRGWTEPASKEKPRLKKSKDGDFKKQELSKYTKDPELLFRTQLPPNVASNLADNSKKPKDKKKRSKNPERKVTVHEFSKTSKHASFLKDKNATKASLVNEYVNGKGWVDEAGNIVEAERPKKGMLTNLSPQKSMAREENDLVENRPQHSLRDDGSGSSSDCDKSPAVAKAKPVRAKATPPTLKIYPPSGSTELAKIDVNDGSDLSSPISSSSVVSSSSDESASLDVPTKALRDISIERRAASPSSPTPPTTATTPKDIHPLEALFKRPKTATPLSSNMTKLAPIKTSFSFFDSDDADVDGEEDNPRMLKEPTTPFTRQDLQWRGTRSAAPTPDTAAIGKKFKLPWVDESDDDNEDEDEMNAADGSTFDANSTPLGTGNSTKTAADQGPEDEKEESEFAKWFWENRGDTNRAWKSRRRDALKAKRQRENRKLSRRMV